jgi:hypothetical protein
MDSASTFSLKKLTWANLKATILSSTALTGTPTAPTAVTGTNTTQLATTAFAYGALSASLNGYQKLPSGLIIQWGYTDFSTQSSKVVTLPIAFPNAGFRTIVSASSGTAFGNILSTDAGSAGQFTIYANASITASIAWIRFGY